MLKSLKSIELVASEPFEVAMGGSLVVTYSIRNPFDQTDLFPDYKFKKFIEISPSQNFSFLILWNSVRDESDLTLCLIDHNSLELFKILPIHSIPEDHKWVSPECFEFVAKVRPSQSQVAPFSTHDLARPTNVKIDYRNQDPKLSFYKIG